jgi:hypothetical protein
MNANHVPVNAYVFIGLASVVMAVVTLMDSNVEDNKTPISNTESSSVTDMLPSLTNPFSSNPADAAINQPPNGEGNMFSNMFESNNKAAQPNPIPNPNVGQPENNNMFNALGNNDNNEGIFGKNENSEYGLLNEMPDDMPPLANPFQQPVGQQPVGQQPGIFGGKKYNKTNKHTSKRNKKTKNHRKK